MLSNYSNLRWLYQSMQRKDQGHCLSLRTEFKYVVCIAWLSQFVYITWKTIKLNLSEQIVCLGFCIGNKGATVVFFLILSSSFPFFLSFFPSSFLYFPAFLSECRPSILSMSILGPQLEDDLNFLGKWKTTSIFKAYGRRPQFFRQMEDDLNL